MINTGALKNAVNNGEQRNFSERVFNSTRRYDTDGSVVGTFDRVDITIQLHGDLMVCTGFRMTDPTHERMLKAARKYISLYYSFYMEDASETTEVEQYGDGYKRTTVLRYSHPFGPVEITVTLSYPYGVNIIDPTICRPDIIIGVN